MTLTSQRACQAAVVVTLAVAAVLAGACVVPPDPPAGAQIKCAGDDECPTNTRCQTALGLCVSAKGFDGSAPQLDGDAALSPERAGASTVVQVTFAVSEPLKDDPVVTVDVGNDQRGAFAVDDDATDRAALRYAFLYTPSGVEVPERPSSVNIHLVDEAGNPADAAGGVVTFDFTGPTFAGAPVVAPALLGPGGTLDVTFTPSEALAAGGAVVDLVQGDTRLALTDAGDGSGDALHFTYHDEGDEPDGAWDVLVTLTDSSGNVSEDLRAATIIVDNTLPAAQGADVRRADGELSRDDDVTDAAAGTTLIVTFAATEPLAISAASPRVRARCPGDTTQDLVRVGDLTSNVVFVYELRPPLVLGEGDCDVVADLVDLAGNVATDAPVAGAEFSFDQTAPAAADVDAAGVVIYRRTPWGSDDTGGAKRFQISGLPNAVEPFARVSVYERADAPQAEAVAHVDADDAGAFDLVLPPVDRAKVFVAAVDSAGNEGPRAVVKNVEWIATLGGKVAGSGFENPHRFESRTFFSNSLAQDSVVEVADESALTDGNDVVTSGASTWTDVSTHADEPDFEDPAVGFDPVHGEVVAFGGASCRCAAPDLAPCAETWVRKGEQWTKIVAPPDPEGDGNPERRVRAALAFDLARGTSLLFGGNDGATLDDTWEWNGTSWHEACTGACASSSPPARDAHAMAYDPIRRKLVLFGGESAVNGGAPFFDDTWEWDGKRWTQVCLDAACVASKPPGRAGHRMTYDPVSHRVLMFGGDVEPALFGTGFFGGGAGSDVGVVNEVWAFDGARWTQLCTDGACAASAPPARTNAGFAFDPRQARAVLFGGVSTATPSPSCDNDNNAQSVQKLADTWTFDGTAWSLLAPPDPERDGNPPARRSTMLVDDPQGGRVVLVSGIDDDPCFALECPHANANDTWEWDGTSWKGVVEPSNQTLANPVPVPVSAGNARTNPAVAAYDATDAEVLLVLSNGETDAWSGRWRAFNAGNAQGASDTATTPLSPAFSSLTSTVMLFGGKSGSSVITTNETRIANSDSYFPTCFNLFGGCNTFVLPPARTAAAMALDPQGRAVMFGGLDGSSNHFADTWVFSGTWTRLLASGPPPGRDHAGMAFDSDRGITVMFGGQADGSGPDANQDTWEWSGSRWVERTASALLPPRRRGPALWYDEARRRVVLFGGDGSGFFGSNCGNGQFSCSDTWEWDGANWVKPAIADPDGDGEPGGRFDPAVAFHAQRRVAVLFGGNNEANVGQSDTWVYDGGGDHRPAQVMFTVFAAAGTDGTESIEDVEARFVSGGVGDGDAAGARLFAWDVDGWHALAENASPSPALVRWDGAETPLEDDGENVLSRLFFGAQRQLVFAVGPAHENGGRAGFGSVDTDSAEVIVRYRLP